MNAPSSLTINDLVIVGRGLDQKGKEAFLRILDTMDALRAENAKLREALENMVHAFGAFANTPKENRCMPTQRECNQRQSWAMQQARAALGKE